MINMLTRNYLSTEVCQAPILPVYRLLLDLLRDHDHGNVSGYRNSFHLAVISHVGKSLTVLETVSPNLQRQFSIPRFSHGYEW